MQVYALILYGSSVFGFHYQWYERTIDADVVVGFEKASVLKTAIRTAIEILRRHVSFPTRLYESYAYSF